MIAALFHAVAHLLAAVADALARTPYAVWRLFVAVWHLLYGYARLLSGGRPAEALGLAALAVLCGLVTVLLVRPRFYEAVALGLGAGLIAWAFVGIAYPGVVPA